MDKGNCNGKLVRYLKCFRLGSEALKVGPVVSGRLPDFLNGKLTAKICYWERMSIISSIP